MEIKLVLANMYFTVTVEKDGEESVYCRWGCDSWDKVEGEFLVGLENPEEIGDLEDLFRAVPVSADNFSFLEEIYRPQETGTGVHPPAKKIQ